MRASNAAATLSQDGGSELRPFSPNSAQELQAVIQQSEGTIPGFGTNGVEPESYHFDRDEAIEFKDLEEFRRRRNAFHSRKKRRRQKLYVDRLQKCQERESAVNKRLKQKHAYLQSSLEKANSIVARIEAAREQEKTQAAFVPHVPQLCVTSAILRTPVQPMQVLPSMNTSYPIQVSTHLSQRRIAVPTIPSLVPLQYSPSLASNREATDLLLPSARLATSCDQVLSLDRCVDGQVTLAALPTAANSLAMPLFMTNDAAPTANVHRHLTMYPNGLAHEMNILATAHLEQQKRLRMLQTSTQIERAEQGVADC